LKRLLGTDVPGSYTFDPAAKTVTFSGLSYTLTLANILLITNVKANTIIYNFADASTGETSFNNNVLTLTYDTTSMSSTDTLQIYLDLESYEESLATLLRRMNKLLESNAVVDNKLRQRVVLEAVGNSNAASSTECAATVPISGLVSLGSIISGTSQNFALSPYTISTVSVQTVTEAPVDQRWRIIEDARNCYANMIRSNLIFS
jgi:hypothetical protein